MNFYVTTVDFIQQSFKSVRRIFIPCLAQLIQGRSYNYPLLTVPVNFTVRAQIIPSFTDCIFDMSNFFQVGFVRQARLLKHMAELHPDSPAELTDPLADLPRSFPCPHCGQAYGSLAKRSAHINRDHREALLAEEQAAAAAALVAPSTSSAAVEDSFAGLLTHTHWPTTEPTGNAPGMQQSHPEVRLPCNLCERTYINDVKLRQHQRNHHGVNGFIGHVNH